MFETASSTHLLTLGQLADLVGVSQHRAKYAVTQYNIEPVGRVGILRIWGEDAIPRLRHALAEIASNRGGHL